MPNEKDYSEVLALVKTKKDMVELVEEVELLEKSLYGERVELEKTLKDKVRVGVAPLLAKLLTSGDRQEVLQKLGEILRNLSFVKVTVAYSPTEEGVEKILAWFVEAMGDQVRLDLEVEPSILGGVRVAFRGKYVDMSIVKYIQEDE